MESPSLRTLLKAQLRPALIGRLRMADWIEMPEREFALEVRKIEKDPLFQKLFFGSDMGQSAIRRQRWPGPGWPCPSMIGPACSRACPGRGHPRRQNRLVSQIRKMGREAFETTAFGRPLSMAEISSGLYPGGGCPSHHDMLLEIGTQASSGPPPQAPSAKYTCLARV